LAYIKSYLEQYSSISNIKIFPIGSSIDKGIFKKTFQVYIKAKFTAMQKIGMRNKDPFE
jgi:hypothetical protein